MPPAGPAAYLVGYLFDAGPIAHGFGEAPLSHADISAWQANSGVVLQAWESQTLRHLSYGYLASLQRARDPACPAPYCTTPTTDARARITECVRSIFGARKSTVN